MNLKQIAKFIKKANYNVPIQIQYFHNKKLTSPIAYVKFSRTLNKDKSIYVWSIIYINKSLKKYLKTTTLKAALLHEVGHLYTGYKIINKKLIELSSTIREYEAQIWSMKRAKALKMTNIKKRILSGFSDWQYFKGNKKERIYKMAWKLAVKNRIIPAKTST